MTTVRHVLFVVAFVFAFVSLMVVGMVVTAAHWVVSRVERALLSVMALLDHLTTLLTRRI